MSLHSVVPSFHYEDNALLVGKSETSFQRSYGSVIIPPSAEIVGVCVCVYVSHSVVFDSLRLHGLYSPPSSSALGII